MSLPTSEAGLHAGQPVQHGHVQAFNTQALSNHQFPSEHPYAIPPHHGQAFAPHQFSHQPAAFQHAASLARVHEASPLDAVVPDVEMREQSPLATFAPQTFEKSLPTTLVQQPNQK